MAEQENEAEARCVCGADVAARQTRAVFVRGNMS